ncbi:hypothetical protein VKT23_020362 [Stygiomarasmius scandens]|uniref:Uncharacterized protein n=1 Tax=Marasmiellus scandens TaxID=2682957 RepID=A0ABR1IJ85_9AGAR
MDSDNAFFPHAGEGEENWSEERSDSGMDDGRESTLTLWRPATPVREETTHWRWVETGGKPANSWGDHLAIIRAPIPPLGPSMGKEWLYQEILQGCGGWGTTTDTYHDSLRAVFLARSDLSEYLRWNTPPTHQDTFPVGLDDIDWAMEQASRAMDAQLLRPTFSGAEVETKRIVLFGRYKTVTDQLSEAQSAIEDLGRAREIVASNRELNDLLLVKAREHNARRVSLQAEFERLDAAAQNFLFLTAVCIVYAR